MIGLGAEINEGDICRSLFGSLPDAVAVARLECGSSGKPADIRIIGVNKVFEEMAGFERQQIIGRSLLTLGHDITVFGADWLEIIAPVAESGVSTRFEYYFTAAQRWCDVLIYRPEPGYIAVICRNITGKVQERDRRQVAENMLREKERRLRSLIDRSREGIVILDHEHRVLDANRCFCEMLGYLPDEVLDMHIWDWEALATEEDIRRDFSNISGLSTSFETRHRRKDGTEFDVEVSVTGLEFSGQSFSICVCRDITEHKKAEEALRQSEAKFRSFVENASDIIYTIDKTGKITYISPNVYKIAGYAPAEVEGHRLSSLMHADDAGGFELLLAEAIESKRWKDTFEYRLRYRDGTLRWHALNGSVVDAANTDPVLIGISRNITERKIYQEHLEYLSVHDQLTGLHNRTFFEKEMSRLQISGEYPVSILSCDLNGFKSINDTYGHQAGDKVLQDAAGILKSSLREGDMVARIGGDEFVIVLSKTDEKACQNILQRIRDNIRRYNQSRSERFISFSIGASTTWDQDTLLTQSFKIADSRMYEEKRLLKEKNIGEPGI